MYPRVFLTIILAVFVFSTNMTIAKAASPREDSCSLVKGFTTDGADGGVRHFATMVAWLPKATADQFNSAFKLMGSYEIVGANAFSLVEIKGIVEEHLLLVETKENGIVYLRLNYEKYAGEMHLTHLALDSPYEKALQKRLIFGSPPKIECD